MMLLEVFKYVQPLIITWIFTIFKVKWLKNCLEKNYKITYLKTAGNLWNKNFGFQNHLEGLKMVLRTKCLAFYDTTDFKQCKSGLRSCEIANPTHCALCLDILLRGFSNWEDFVLGGFCAGRILCWEDFVWGGFCAGRILCREDFVPWGFCTWEDFVPGGKWVAS